MDCDLCARLDFAGQVTAADADEPEVSASVFWLAAGPGGSLERRRLLHLIRPTVGDFCAQLDLVTNYADLRPDRAPEILEQRGFPSAFFRSVIALEPTRTRHTNELILLCQMLAAKVAMRVKHSLACRRPDAYSPQIQPMIATPGHGALPSAHATEAFIVARVLHRLAASGAKRAPVRDMLYRQAARIAVNRTVAGVHFPADSIAGAMMGLVLGDYVVARARGGALDTATFRGRGIGALDFDHHLLIEDGETAADAGGVVARGETIALGTDDVSAPLNWLWRTAEAEWDGA